MAMRQFKAESKKLLDLMINSIYTNREIFLRELISNASDACDKRYFKSLTDTSIGITKDDLKIHIQPDKDSRTLTITDNGIGMTKEELEKNLGTIARSGSLDFKTENQSDNIDIIGQFGVGFYSAFMVAKKVTVISRAQGAEKVTVISKKFGSDEAWKWESTGVEGYTLTEADKEDVGTEIILVLKDDTDTDKYSEYLEDYELANLVKKYSDYIRFPITMYREKSRQKPKPEEVYTNLSILGRVLLTPDIFEILENTAPGAGGEIHLTDAMRVLANRGGMTAVDFDGERFDFGSKLGFLKANVTEAVKHPEVGEEFKAFLKEFVKTL